MAQRKFAKQHLNKPQNCWNNVLWTDDTKVEMFGYNAHLKPSNKENQTQDISTDTSYQLSVMVLED